MGKDGNFYGTTAGGNFLPNYDSTLFSLSPEGQFTTLAFFDPTDGLIPAATMIQGQDGNLYGTTFGSLYFDCPYGNVFKATTNGLLSSLVTFTNDNGANPFAGLTLGSDGTFYGATTDGGRYGAGTVFSVTSNGTFSVVVDFAWTNGYGPYGTLILGNDGALYGTTSGYSAGSSAYTYGTVFKVTTNGALTTLFSFVNDTNGANPLAV